MEQLEQYFNCPYCGENISILIDSSTTPQHYIEDCEICCRPIELNFVFGEGMLQGWKASRTDT